MINHSVHREVRDSIDHVYVNLNFTNNASPDITIPAKFTQSYDRDIITCPSDWNVAIARFSISSDTIARVYQPFPTTSINSTLFVSLSFNGLYYDYPIVLPTFTSPGGSQFQAVYNIFDFLRLINSAWSLAQADVISAGGPTGPGLVFMSYDPPTKLYYVNVPSFYGTGSVGTTGNGIGVHMSYQLYHKFQSFSVSYNQPYLNNKHDFTFIREWTGDNYASIRYPNPGVTGDYMVLKQEEQWASSLMDVTRLIITTANIPVVYEYRSQQNFSQAGAGSSNQVLGIMSDFFIGSDTDLANRAEHWNYTPDQWRLSSLTGNNPLRQFDFQIFVATADGSIFPIYLSSLDSIDIKLVFLKKGLTS